MVHHLQPVDPVSRSNFRNWLQLSLFIFMTVQAWFHLSCYIAHRTQDRGILKIHVIHQIPLIT